MDTSIDTEACIEFRETVRAAPTSASELRFSTAAHRPTRAMMTIVETIREIKSLSIWRIPHDRFTALFTPMLFRSGSFDFCGNIV
jgi:hypothetical protein